MLKPNLVGATKSLGTPRKLIWGLIAAGTLLNGIAKQTYYVRPDGDDTASGQSVAAAWKTIERINQHRFLPGDEILLKGGQEFAGTVWLSNEDSGAPEAPVRLGSFGEGPARVAPAEGGGIAVSNAAHVEIRGLIVKGHSPKANNANGILFENATKERLVGVRIEEVEVSGFGQHGIFITGPEQGFENVTVERSSAHHNVRGGLEIAGRLPYDAKHYAHKNVVVRDCAAYENSGDPTYRQNHSGSGIVLYQVDGGLVERSSAWGNGAECPAAGGGPVGIWACASRKVVIQHCQSFGNLTRGLDGGGFDLDGGSEECVLQYNLSRNNAGPGLMVYTYPYASHRDRGNVVRFNVSINDARGDARYGGLWVRGDEKKMEGLSIHNNTVINEHRAAAVIFGANITGEFKNNIFISGRQGIALKVEGGHAGLAVCQNLYWRGGEPLDLAWNGQKFESLAAWAQPAADSSRAACAGDVALDPKIVFEREAFSGSQVLPWAQLAALEPGNAEVYGLGRAVMMPAGAQRDILGRAMPEGLAWPLGALVGSPTGQGK